MVTRKRKSVIDPKTGRVRKVHQTTAMNKKRKILIKQINEWEKKNGKQFRRTT